MSDNHETTENKIGVGNDIQETSMDSNPINTAPEQGSDKGSKDVIRIWPSLVVVLLYFTAWIFYYHEFCRLSVGFFLVVFFVFCISCSLYLSIRKKFAKSLSFIFPILLLVFTTSSPWQITRKIGSSRHYVEFLIHKKEIISDLNKLNWPEYKEWLLNKQDVYMSYTIIYDSKDGVIKGKADSSLEEYRQERIDFYYAQRCTPEATRKMADLDVAKRMAKRTYYKVGEHFYMRTELE